MIVFEFLIAFLLVVGGVFGLIGSYGLVKLDQPMKRLHGPTQTVTLGLGPILIASMLYGPVYLGVWTWHEFLITLFVTLVAPVTGYFIAKANIHQNETPETLPRPREGESWVTFCPDDLVLDEEDLQADRRM